MLKTFEFEVMIETSEEVDQFMSLYGHYMELKIDQDRKNSVLQWLPFAFVKFDDGLVKGKRVVRFQDLPDKVLDQMLGTFYKPKSDKNEDEKAGVPSSVSVKTMEEKLGIDPTRGREVLRLLKWLMDETDEIDVRQGFTITFMKMLKAKVDILKKICKET